MISVQANHPPRPNKSAAKRRAHAGAAAAPVRLTRARVGIEAAAAASAAAASAPGEQLDAGQMGTGGEGVAAAAATATAAGAASGAAAREPLQASRQPLHQRTANIAPFSGAIHDAGRRLSHATHAPRSHDDDDAGCSSHDVSDDGPGAASSSSSEEGSGLFTSSGGSDDDDAVLASALAARLCSPQCATTSARAGVGGTQWSPRALQCCAKPAGASVSHGATPVPAKLTARKNVPATPSSLPPEPAALAAARFLDMAQGLEDAAGADAAAGVRAIGTFGVALAPAVPSAAASSLSAFPSDGRDGDEAMHLAVDQSGKALCGRSFYVKH